MNKELRDSQGVYVVHIVDLENEVNYVYIGSGKLGDRTVGNASKLRRNAHSNKQFQEIYNKIGECKIEILEVCESIEEARELENNYIDYYKKLDGVIVCNKYEATVMENQYKFVLDKEKVMEIKLLLAEGKMKNKEIAKIYGVKECNISKIKTGLRWVNVNIETEIGGVE